MERWEGTPPPPTALPSSLPLHTPKVVLSAVLNSAGREMLTTMTAAGAAERGRGASPSSFSSATVPTTTTTTIASTRTGSPKNERPQEQEQYYYCNPDVSRIAFLMFLRPVPPPAEVESHWNYFLNCLHFPTTTRVMEEAKKKREQEQEQQETRRDKKEEPTSPPEGGGVKEEEDALVREAGRSIPSFSSTSSSTHQERSSVPKHSSPTPTRSSHSHRFHQQQQEDQKQMPSVASASPARTAMLVSEVSQLIFRSVDNNTNNNGGRGSSFLSSCHPLPTAPPSTFIAWFRSREREREGRRRWKKKMLQEEEERKKGCRRRRGSVEDTRPTSCWNSPSSSPLPYYYSHFWDPLFSSDTSPWREPSSPFSATKRNDDRERESTPLTINTRNNSSSNRNDNIIVGKEDSDARGCDSARPSLREREKKRNTTDRQGGKEEAHWSRTSSGRKRSSGEAPSLAAAPAPTTTSSVVVRVHPQDSYYQDPYASFLSSTPWGGDLPGVAGVGENSSSRTPSSAGNPLPSLPPSSLSYSPRGEWGMEDEEEVEKGDTHAVDYDYDAHPRSSRSDGSLAPTHMVSSSTTTGITVTKSSSSRSSSRPFLVRNDPVSSSHAENEDLDTVRKGEDKKRMEEGKILQNNVFHSPSRNMYRHNNNNNNEKEEEKRSKKGYRSPLPPPSSAITLAPGSPTFSSSSSSSSSVDALGSTTTPLPLLSPSPSLSPPPLTGAGYHKEEQEEKKKDRNRRSSTGASYRSETSHRVVSTSPSYSTSLLSPSSSTTTVISSGPRPPPTPPPASSKYPPLHPLLTLLFSDAFRASPASVSASSSSPFKQLPLLSSFSSHPSPRSARSTSNSNSSKNTESHSSGEHHEREKMKIRKGEEGECMAREKYQEWEEKKANVFHKYATLQERIASFSVQVEGALEEVEEKEGGIWSPNYRPLKSLKEELLQWSERGRRAYQLYTVERHEEGTIRLAHGALLGEVIAMKLLLKDIQELAQGSLALAEDARRGGRDLVGFSPFPTGTSGKDGVGEEQEWVTPAEDVLEEDTQLAAQVLECLSH